MIVTEAPSQQQDEAVKDERLEWYGDVNNQNVCGCFRSAPEDRTLARQQRTAEVPWQTLSSVVVCVNRMPP